MAPLDQFHHLLVPVDFSEEDESLLRLVLGLSNRPRVTLMHVVEALEPDPEDDLDEFYGMLQANAERKIGELGTRFRTAGFEVVEEVRVGRRTGEIVRFAAAVSCDLIVMRTRTIDPNRPEEAFRALAQQVMALCSCPVLVLKEAVGSRQ
ncbi:MAG: universal stress protein [Planctomycetaceae bacterium]